MSSRLPFLLLFVVIACRTEPQPSVSEPQSPPPAEPTATEFIPPSDHWEPDIRAWEAQDALQMPPAGGVVFVGSSSIRLWHSLADDMAPLPVIQRGFGGSRIYDAVRFADRIITKYDPKLVVVFSGTNDVAGHEHDLRPTTILRGYEQLAQHVLTHDDTVEMYYISITPSVLRRAKLDDVRRTNRLIRGFSAQNPRLHFFDLQDIFLDDAGEPRPELFVEDGLHLNADGYALWTEAMKPELLRAFRE